MSKFITHSDRLRIAWPRMTPAEQELVCEMQDYYEDQFSADRKAGHQPEGLAAGIHDCIDKLLDRFLAKHPKAGVVKCHRGCTHCCFVPVAVTREEALLLHHAAHEAGISLDPDKLRQRAPGDACPFLDVMGSCKVYEHRPMACRKYMVLSDPARCDMKKYPKGDVLNLVCIEAEVVFSAAFKALERGEMTAMLLKHEPSEETS